MNDLVMVANPCPTNEDDVLVAASYTEVFGHLPPLDSPINEVYEGLLTALTMMEQYISDVDRDLVYSNINRIQRWIVSTGMFEEGKMLESTVIALIYWVISIVSQIWESEKPEEYKREVEIIKKRVTEKVSRIPKEGTVDETTDIT